MKKFLLLMSFIVVALIAKADQQYDERDLLGTWEVTGRSGSTPLLDWVEEHSLNSHEFKFLQLGFYNQKVDPSWGGHYEMEADMGGMMTSVNPQLPEPDDELDGKMIISDFLISNGNKLHLCLYHGYMINNFRFVIDSFTDDELKLSSFDHQLHLTLTRISGNSKTADIPTADNTPNEIYTLSGIKVKRPGKGIHIIKMDNDVSKKVII